MGTDYLHLVDNFITDTGVESVTRRDLHAWLWGEGLTGWSLQDVTNLLQAYKLHQGPGVTAYVLGKPGYGRGASFPVCKPDEYTVEVRKGVEDGLRRMQVDLSTRAQQAAAHDSAEAAKYASAAEVLGSAQKIMQIALNGIT